MAQAARGECTWPWLARFVQSLMRAVRVAVRFSPPGPGEGPFVVQTVSVPSEVTALLDRHDDDVAALLSRDRKAVHRRLTVNGQEITQLATPLSGDGELRGGLLAWVALPPNQGPEPYLVALQLVAGFGQETVHGRRAQGDPRVGEALASLSGRIASATDVTAAAQAFADEAVRMTGCSTAAFALERGGVWRAAAVSGVLRLDPSGPMAQAVIAALREIETTASTGALSEAAESSPIFSDLARMWDCRAVRAWVLPAAGPGTGLFASDTGRRLPVPSGGSAAILLGFREVDAAGAGLDRLLRLATPGWASLVRIALRLGFAAAARESLGRAARPLTSVRGILVLLLLAFAAWGLMQPIPHSIRAVARVEASDPRTVAAPIEGTLRTNQVRIGEAVKAGQRLGEMDDSEVLIRLSEAKAARERALALHAATMGREGADAARGQLALLDAQAAEIEIRLLEHRRSALALVSPVDGIVMREASRLVGAHLPLGQPLYEIASAGGIRLELDVPDNRIAYVHEGLEAHLAIESFPGQSWTVRLSKLHPQSEVRDGANLFVVEADPSVAVPEWKPGMKGRASIQSEPRAVGWVLFHPVWEFVEWLLFW